jgi:branched-chain amino acid transport system ATP-binding protein
VADAVLALEHLTAGYDTAAVIRSVDLTVGAGEVVALLGANGAGKTSTLRAISGLVPYQGQIVFDGVDTKKANIEQLARMGLIHVPEGRHVFPSLNVHENLQVGTTAGAGRSEGFSIDDVYDLFPPLALLKKRDGWALSGGEQQMVAIGRALVAKPRLLLLDEPSLGLSPKYTQSVYSALSQVKDRIPMLLVEQNTVMAVMVGGKLVLEGTAADLADREALVASYLGEEPALAGEETALHREDVS